MASAVRSPEAHVAHSALHHWPALAPAEPRRGGRLGEVLEILGVACDRPTAVRGQLHTLTRYILQSHDTSHTSQHVSHSETRDDNLVGSTQPRLPSGDNTAAPKHDPHTATLCPASRSAPLARRCPHTTRAADSTTHPLSSQ